MAMMKYWFSAKQKRMRDALCGAVTLVSTDTGWVEYTQVTTEDTTPAVWNDFVLVASGDGLECITQTLPYDDSFASGVSADAVQEVSGQRVTV